MNNRANPAQVFIDRKAKNMAYFEKNYPQIFKFFSDYKMSSWKLNILPERDEVDLISQDGVSLYKNAGKEYAEKEVGIFRQAYRENSYIQSIYPPFQGEFYHPRFVHQQIDELIRQSPLKRENFRGYRLENFYPIVVFLGCGIGYHIQKMILEHDVSSAIIVEPDLDKFAASLYAVDWEELGTRFSVHEGRMLHFIIGAANDEHILWAATWNRLIECCPIFPVTTLFYNHQGDKLFDRVSDKINDDLYVYLGSWGHYDDEIRQLNNAVHNFHQKLKRLPPKTTKAWNTPVFIFGSGPSVDERVELIKANRDKVIVVSCGTALRSLEHHQLLPDFHVELESDYNVYKLTSKVDHDFLKSIPIIAPSHISPLVYTLFKDARYYFKAESALSQLFGTEEETIHNGTPTCTNAAIAVVAHLGFKNVHLVGLDFGFKSREKHHADGSVYNRSDLPEELKRRRGFNAWELITITGVEGETIYTIPTYYNAKRKAEHLIASLRNADKQFVARNCSNGADIEHTEWVSNSELDAMLKQEVSSDKNDALAHIFQKRAPRLSLKTLEHKLIFIEKKLEEIAADMQTLLKDQQYNGLKSYVRLCERLNHYIENVLKKHEPGFYFFIRGSLRHLLHVGYSHLFGLTDESQRQAWFDLWQKTSLEITGSLPDHYRRVIQKSYDLKSDPWVRQTINEPETYVQ